MNVKIYETIHSSGRKVQNRIYLQMSQRKTSDEDDDDGTNVKIGDN